jgi:hypothetical protein
MNARATLWKASVSWSSIQGARADGESSKRVPDRLRPRGHFVEAGGVQVRANGEARRFVGGVDEAVEALGGIG